MSDILFHLRAESRPGFIAVRDDAPPEPIRFEAAQGAGEKRFRRFSMTAYTGGVMRGTTFGAPIVVDLAGMEIPTQVRPVLRSHDADRILGQTESIDATQQRLRAVGVITGSGAHVQEVLELAANDFPWQVSMGADLVTVVYVEAGQSDTVNGRKFAGPLYVARRSILKELSLTPIGADDATSARIAAELTAPRVEVMTMTFELWCKGKGWDAVTLTAEQRKSLEAAWRAETAPAPVPVPHPAPAAYPAPGPAPANPPPPNDLNAEMARLRERRERGDRITTLARNLGEQHPRMIEELQALANQSIEADHNPDQFELAAMRLTRTAPSPIRSARGGGSDESISSEVVEAAICLQGKLSGIERAFPAPVLEASHRRFRHGLGMMELFQLTARAKGWRGDTARDKEMMRAAFSGGAPLGLQAAGFSTLDISGILSNVANKFLLQGFMFVERTCMEIAARRSVRDFKQVTSYRLTGMGKYQKVGPGGELHHGTLGEESFANKADTYGLVLAITRQDQINDDLGALTQVPAMHGRGAGLALNDIFWTEFLDNASFFTTGHGNYATGAATALSIDSLTQFDTLFRKMVDTKGDPIGHEPRILLVPPELYVLALRLMNSTELREVQDTAAGAGTIRAYGTSNVFAGKYRALTSRYLSNSSYSGYSAVAWHLLADPMDVPVIEIAFLNGVETPTIETATLADDTLGIKLIGYHDFGVAKQDYKGGVKSKGAA